MALQLLSSSVQCPLPVAHWFWGLVCLLKHANRNTISETHTHTHTHSSELQSSLFSLTLQKCCMFKQVVNRCVLTGMALSAVHSLWYTLIRCYQLLSPWIVCVCCLVSFPVISRFLMFISVARCNVQRVVCRLFLGVLLGCHLHFEAHNEANTAKVTKIEQQH